MTQELAMWIETKKQLPPEGVVVKTKIDDEKGCRNEQELKLIRNLWFFPDGLMYVYYNPTHWQWTKVRRDPGTMAP